MDRKQRRKIVVHHLVDMGESMTSWAEKNGQADAERDPRICQTRRELRF